MSPELKQVETLVKAPSPYYSKMELLGALYWQKRAASSLPMEDYKGASGGLKVGKIPSGISR